MGRPKTPVPIELAAEVRSHIYRARLHNADPVEVLNHKDLILTQHHERRIRIEALQRLADELVRWQPHEMLRRKYHAGHSATPADMYIVIQEFLDEMIDHEKTREW